MPTESGMNVSTPAGKGLMSRELCGAWAVTAWHWAFWAGITEGSWLRC